MRNLLRFFALLSALAMLAFSFASCGGDGIHTARVYAMGTLCTLTEVLPKGEDGDSSPLFSSVLSETEALLSHRVSGSDASVASLLNGLGYAVIGGEHRLLLEELRLAEELKEKTGGLFSLSVLPISSLWNFDAESPAPPTEDAIRAALAQMQGSALSFENETVRKTGGDVDFGALGKGYACAVLAEKIRALDKNALVAVGGSLAAIGTKSGKPWQVGVRDPFSSSQTKTLGTLSLTDTFVSTSGSYEKCFTYEGKLYHHILNPHTGMPAESDLVSVTVVAGKGTLTDMLSTACFLVGSDAAFALAAEYGASLIAVKTDGTLLVSEALRDIFVPKSGFTPVYR